MSFIPDWIDSPLLPIPTIQNLPLWYITKEANISLKKNSRTDFILYSRNGNRITSQPSLQKNTAISHSKKNKYIQTEYSILYLHGYTSSPKEQYPLVDIISKKLRANTISIRMDGHGISLGSMHFLSQEQWYQSALEGLTVANKLGKKVIVISCSTGSTLGLLLSARETAHIEQSLHICLSPNLGIYLSKLVRILYLHPLIQRAIYYISYLAKHSAIVLRAKAHNTFHESITTLEQPLSAVHPMLQLVYLLWNIRKKTPHRFIVPTTVFAQENDRVVDFALTKKFFKNLASTHFAQLPTTTFTHSHILAGDALSPNTTNSMANAILTTITHHFKNRKEHV